MNESPITTNQVESKAKRLILMLGLLLVLVACGVLIYQMLSNPNGSSSANQASACVSVGGTFDHKHNECGGISEAKCKSIGGKFVTCASPCRHLSTDTACIEMCEQYCQL